MLAGGTLVYVSTSVVEGCGQLFHLPKIKTSLGHFGMESVPDPLLRDGDPHNL